MQKNIEDNRFFRRAKSSRDFLQDKSNLPPGWMARAGWSPPARKRRGRQGLLLWRSRRGPSRRRRGK